MGGIVALLIAPLFISASLHMVLVRFRLFSFSAQPLSQKLFGQNKTWRGLWTMPVLTVIGVEAVTEVAASFNYLPEFWPVTFVERMHLGIALGLAYVLFELPNSWMKRRLGIPPGQKAQKNAWLFTMIDQADSALGCALVYALLIPETRSYFWILLLISPVIHLVGNLLLYSFGLRKEAV